MSNSAGAWAGIGTTLLGGLTSAFGDILGGQSQQEMYDYQAGIARLNAQIAYQNATYASNVGEIQAMQAGLQGGQQLGKIKAAQSASGLDVNTGSNKAIQVSQAQVIGQNTAAIRSNAAKTAYNYEVQGVGFEAQASLDTLAGQNARTAGVIGAFSSIVGAASSVSSEWLRGSQLGLTPSPNASANTSLNPQPQALGSGGGNAPYGTPSGQGGIGMM